MAEEFVVVCDKADSKTVVSALEELRESITGRDFIIQDKDRPRKRPQSPSRRSAREGIRITVSIGFACSGDKVLEPTDVFKAADKALYRAMKAGRNRLKSANVNQ
jgi:diguanylate cyclase (GGDEF)-like protein